MHAPLMDHFVRSDATGNWAGGALFTVAGETIVNALEK